MPDHPEQLCCAVLCCCAAVLLCCCAASLWLAILKQPPLAPDLAAPNQSNTLGATTFRAWAGQAV